MSFKRVLVANRGEIAVRIIHACDALGIESVLAVSKADRESLAAKMATRVVCVGPASAAGSYLNQQSLLAAALGTKSDAVHPGYGFLAENPKFAEECERRGLVFVGPRPEAVYLMGNKLAAREVAERNGVPIVPGSHHVRNYEDAKKVAAEIGFPVLFKAASGGGGRGIRIVSRVDELEVTFQSAAAEAEAAFGDGTLYLERYIEAGRHVEVQVFGDRFGKVVHFGERDCSLQRRFQKIVEEAPAVMIPIEVRESMRTSATRLAGAIGYENAGTVEFIYDEQSRSYYFLEMNTRIQVEHPITEAITGLDLVQLQLEVAEGQALPLEQSDVHFDGHAIECRINAESPANDFRPSPGRITRWRTPQGAGIRLDTHCYEGYTVPPFYDSLLGKLVTHGSDRAEARKRMQDTLGQLEVTGIDTNAEFLSFLVGHQDFKAGQYNTRWVEGHLGEFRGAAGIHLQR